VSPLARNRKFESISLPGESLRTFGSWTLSMRIEQQGEVLAVICLDGSGEGGQQIANHRLKKLALSR
jgi:hypothetical protein